MNFKGLKKSAKLLILVGSKKSAKVLKLLTVSEIEKIIHLMLEIKKISFEEISKICSECKDLLKQIDNDKQELDKYIFPTLNEALDEICKTNCSSNVNTNRILLRKINILSSMKSTEIVNLLDKQHPQLIAAILIYMQRIKGAEILSLLDKKKQLEVILRIASSSKLTNLSQIEMLKVIDILLNDSNSPKEDNIINNTNIMFGDKNSTSTRRIKINNINTSIDIAIDFLKLLDNHTRNEIINDINNMNTDFSKQIINKMFLFKDIYYLLDEDIRLLLKEIILEDLYIAIFNMNDKFKKKFMSNMSTFQLNYFNNQIINSSLNVSNEMVKKKQEYILNIVKILIKQKKISINKLEKRYV